MVKLINHNGCYTLKWNESDTLKWIVFAGGCLWIAYFVFIRIFVNSLPARMRRMY